MAIHGNEPTGYSYGAADALTTAVNNLAGAIDGQTASRASYVGTAQLEFRGYFADAFGNNADIASRSATDLVRALRGLVGFIAELRQAAKDEDKRRADAKAWDERQRLREENGFEGFKHDVASFFGFGDDPEPPPPEPEPQCTAEEVRVKGRDIPAPGGSNSMSSAAPADLRAFQSGIQSLDGVITPKAATFSSALSSYETGCNPCWGTLNAQALVTAVNDWLNANQTDADWAGMVAAQFEAAGSGSTVVTLSDASIAAALQAAGINVTRDDFTIGAYSAIGTPPTNGFADDPVNTATGNFLEPETDLPFAGAAQSLKLTRTYNSLDPRLGVFGLGWASVLDLRLEIDDEGAVFVMDDGRQIHFPRCGAGWDRGVGENYWLSAESRSSLPVLAAEPGEVLVVRDNTGAWWAFTATGRWLATGHGPGTGVLVHRDDDGQITRLAHERGRYLDVEYVGDRVAYAAASDGRRMEYLYDDQRRLIGARDLVGVRSYRWNEQGLVDQVISAAGVVECENSYDPNGRVIEQLTSVGRRVRFAYLGGRVTSVSDPDGSATNTWIADQKGRVVGIIDADGNRQSMSYDRFGNLVSVTERDGQVTVHGYDERGRKVRAVTPEGADITYGYDEYDRVSTVVTASGGVVSYSYADAVDRNPSLIVDPVGGRTRLTWRQGLLTEVIDPMGVRVSFDYDASGDLIGTINAVGDRASLIRDHTGRVVEAITPSGSRTRYSYDQQGLLVSRKDPDGGVWRFRAWSGRQSLRDRRSLRCPHRA